jgi:hypothetical protein
MTIQPALVAARAIAIILTSFELRPAVAADGLNTQQVAAVGAARHSRRGDQAVPLAAFGALADAIVSIAAAQHQQESYGPYYTPYYAPYVYEPYRRPLYEHRDSYRRWGGSGQAPRLVTRPASGGN